MLEIAATTTFQRPSLMIVSAIGVPRGIITALMTVVVVSMVIVVPRISIAGPRASMLSSSSIPVPPVPVLVAGSISIVTC